MADNITAPAAGAILATDEISNVHFPKSKLAFGANGTATDVSTTDRLPVALPSGFATEAKQDAMIEAIENISPGGGGGGDASAANQATIIAALSTIAGHVDGLETLTGQQATAAKQDTAQTSLTTLIGHVDGIETLLGTLGTQTTLNAILAKLIAAPATEAKQDTIIGHVDGIEAALASVLAKIIAAPATEAKQDALIALWTLPAGTDRSGSITAGGTAQQLAAANAGRKSLTVQNISDADLWINEIGANAAADMAGSWKVPAGSVFSVSTNRAISIVGATTGKKFTATEV